MFICVHLWLNSSAAAAWLDAAFPYRRAIDVTWDAEHGSPDDLGYAEFYSSGKHDPSGKDIRVATEDGKLVPSDVLMIGPGDRIRIAFMLQKNVKKYYVYWGNPNPPESKPGMVYHRGMLLEMKSLPGGNEGNRHMREAFDRATDLIGRTIVERPFIGNNVLTDQAQTISKLTGQLFAPLDGEYQFAMAADDRGVLFIDNQQVLIARGAPGDIRFNGKMTLTRGGHDLVIYQVDSGGDWKLSLGWKRPDMQKVEVVNRDAVGFPFSGTPGPLEEIKKSLVADFALEYLGESWYADRISHRYRFNAYAPKMEGAKYDWDFGDGQTASGQKVDHVYLNAGVYPVKLTVHLGSNSDSRTNRLPVNRQFERLAHVKNDDLVTQSNVVAKYDLNTLTSNDLARAVLMHHRAGQWDAMQAAAEQLASLKRQAEPEAAFASINEAANELQDRKDAATVESLWSKVPGESNLQPRASRHRARVLMWGMADFSKAASVLKPGEKDVQNRRLLAMAMVLNGSVDDGTKILRDLPEQGEPEKRAAIAGAMARTIEYFIDDKDPDSGDDQWDKWMSRYPVDFLSGHAVVLKVRLIETRKNPVAAAKVAEAFALAVPRSSYAPQLLDLASKLLAATDANHSAEIRTMLKQRYPEDPLSQDKK